MYYIIQDGCTIIGQGRTEKSAIRNMNKHFPGEEIDEKVEIKNFTASKCGNRVDGELILCDSKSDDPEEKEYIQDYLDV